jgi:hypothetical protein
MPKKEKRPALNVLSAMMAQNWAILPDALETMLSIAERNNMDVEALEKQQGEPLKNAHKVTVRDGIATIEAAGPMIRYASIFSRISGATAYQTLATDFAAPSRILGSRGSSSRSTARAVRSTAISS